MNEAFKYVVLVAWIQVVFKLYFEKWSCRAINEYMPRNICELKEKKKERAGERKDSPDDIK